MSLAHEEVGSGAPVVLLHAFPLDRAMWRPQRDALADACRLITPDLPGFGASTILGTTPTVEAMADEVIALLDRLGVREKVVLGGLSMGGYVAFAVARKHPERLRGLILCDTRAEPDDEAAKANRNKMIEFVTHHPVAELFEQFMLPKMFSPQTAADRPEVVAEVKRIVAAQRPAGVVGALHMLRDRPDSRPTLATLSLPALFIVGRDDALTPPAMSEAMAAQLPGSRVEVIDGAGHLSNLEQPAAFNAAVRSFLATA